MADPAPAADPAPTTAPPWHAGIETDTLGWWQNKGYDLSEPKAFATKITQQYRDLEKHLGGPADRLIKLPEKVDDTAGWDAVWQRLGAPKEAKDYDFSTVKHADGNAPEPALIEAIRQAAAAVHAPKDRAAELANAVIKHLDSVQLDRAAAMKVALDAEKAALAKNWPSANFEFNKLKAMEGAQRLGVTAEDVANLEKGIGYARTMEMFRRIGASTTEDTFVGGRSSGGGAVTTVEGAHSRLNDLLADVEWGKRLTRGDAAAVQEYQNLTTVIANAA